jgi:hypothetical protein
MSAKRPHGGVAGTMILLESLPLFLIMVRDAPEFLGIQPQLPRHLDMNVRQAESFSSVNPHLKFWRKLPVQALSEVDGLYRTH